MGPVGIAMTKGLPYGIFMKQIIYEITERGQLHKLQKKWEVPSPQCHSVQRKGKPLSFPKLMSAFMISFLGISISLIVLLIENILHHARTGENSKQMKHVTIKEANKTNLLRLFSRFQKIVNDDDVFLEIDMDRLMNEMKNHNSLFDDG